MSDEKANDGEEERTLDEKMEELRQKDWQFPPQAAAKPQGVNPLMFLANRSQAQRKRGKAVLDNEQDSGAAAGEGRKEEIDTDSTTDVEQDSHGGT